MGSKASNPVVATFGDYSGAQRAVDFLSDQKFPVESVAIVGNGLRMVENVVGRLSWGRAMLSGFAGGAWVGLLVGLLIALFAERPFNVMLWAALYGGVFGLVFGVIGYAFSGGRRDFVSTQSLVATSYDVTCEPAQADEARRLLAQTPVLDGPSGPSAPPSAPAV